MIKPRSTKGCQFCFLLLLKFPSSSVHAGSEYHSTPDIASIQDVATTRIEPEPTCDSTPCDGNEPTDAAVILAAALAINKPNTSEEEYDMTEGEEDLLCEYDDFAFTIDDVYAWRADDTIKHDWENLDCHQKAYLIDEYDYDDDTWDCRADPEVLLQFDEMPPERQRAWAAKGWNPETFKIFEHHPCTFPFQYSTPDAFNPLLIRLEVPEVDKYSTQWLLKVEQPVRMLDGYGRQPGDERYTKTMPLGKIVEKALNDDLNFMMFVEQDQHEKYLLNELIGDHIIEVLKEAVNSNPAFKETGNWKTAWYEDLQRQDWDWAIIMAPKGSTTPTHYDSDVFNMLYLVEGKKRVVLLPNDERTAGTFETSLNDDGGTAWGYIDMLDKSKALPKYAEEFIVEAGQALVIPRFTWHAVENLEPSLSYSLRVLG